MVLILEVAGPQAAQLGAASRMVFGVEGGLIGRDARNPWVLPHTKVSGRHARIFHQNGIFYIEDTSTNGVFMNGSKSRLGKGRSFALKSGDSILIDPYKINVSVSSSDYAEPAGRRYSPVPSPRAPVHDPFGLEDPFAEQGVPFGDQIVPQAHDPHAEPLAGQEVDPLKLLGGQQPARRPPARKAPSAQDLERGSPLEGHYQPPRVVTQTPPPTPVPEPPSPDNPFAIPADYDPLAPATKYRIASDPVRPAAQPPAQRPAPPPSRPAPEPPLPPPDIVDFPEPFEPISPAPAMDRDHASPAPAEDRDVPSLGPPIVSAPDVPAPTPAATPPPGGEPPRASATSTPTIPTPASSPRVTPPQAHVSSRPVEPRAQSVPVAPTADAFTLDLRAVLEGAGLDPEDVTPELARDFGKILRVVVGGLMEVLQARHNVKDEFRMRVTQFRPVDNNPLKFSANVDDALHNLLVKRNAAYLKPVEAFDDAFDDLRHHQLAMLAGMRTAFEAMLNEFHPDRLQEQFDRQLKRGVLGVATKLRYWDLYRDQHEELFKDPEVAFRRLFGDAFAKAYEEQLQRLKSQSARADSGKPPEDADQ